MRSSIFLVVPFAAVALGQVVNSGGTVTSQSVISTSFTPATPLSSSVLVLSVVANTTVTSSIKQTTTATTLTGTQNGTKNTSAGSTHSGTSSSTGASTSLPTGAAARMIQPVFGLGLVGVIVAALF